MLNPLQNAGLFLLHTFFNIYITIVLLRFFFQLFRVDFYNPLSQFIVKATSPILRPLRRIIPGWMGIDFASVVLLLVLQIAESLGTTWILTQSIPMLSMNGWMGVLIWSFGELIAHSLGLFTVLVFINILGSWLPQLQFHPMFVLIRQMTSPLMRPAQRLLPAMGGIDFSPILVLIFLQLATFLVADPIRILGKSF